MFKSSLQRFAVILTALAAAGAQPPQARRPDGVKVLRDVEYARAGNKALLLDLYLPQSAPAPLPLVIWIHGGGWSAGSKAGGQGFRLAGRGYAVGSVEYRLSGEAIFPAQIEDCKAAVRWLRANARKYNLDPERFAAWGSSAGGHLVALLGTSGNVKDLEGSLGNLDQSSRVQAVIDFFGPTDLLQMDAQAALNPAVVSKIKHNDPKSPESRFIGGPIQEFPDKAARANPITYVSRDDPPFLIMHGDQDPLVPAAQSRILYEALQAAGVDATFHVVKGAGHGFGGPEIERTVDEFLARTLKGRPPQRPAGEVDIKAESRVIRRGDVELLTFETEQDVRTLDDLYEKCRKSTPEPGALTPQYLRSRTDGSVQPYALWLPKGYSSAQRYPLLVQLHGLGPKNVSGRRHLWKGMGVREWVDVNTPVIIAHCYGRSNTFYEGMGEVDVLETMDDIESRFSVDPERVYIMGHSMGGAGSFTIGLHYPDRFGSITPLDPAMTGRILIQASEEMPGWMRPQVAIRTNANLYANARNVPVFFKNAGAGIQGKSTEYTDAIVAQGGFSTSESFPGLPHNFAPQIPYAVFVPEAIQQPLKRNPPEVKFYTNTMQYDHTYWVTIDRLTHHNQDAFITATYDDGKPRPVPATRPGPPAPPKMTDPRPPSVTVTARNIDAVTLRLAGAAMAEDASAALKIDGSEVLSGQMPKLVHLSKLSGAWRVVEAPPVSGKKHGMQGPIGDAFNSRFLAVYGEGDRDLAIAELDAIRNPPGSRLSVQGEFPMKAASKITPEDVRSSNLILFGTAGSNALLRRIAGKLPAPLMARAGTGTIFIYPNPENPGRYVVVWTGKLLSAGDGNLARGFLLPVNALPDYVTLRDGKIESGGHFDSDWKLVRMPQ